MIYDDSRQFISVMEYERFQLQSGNHAEAIWKGLGALPPSSRGGGKLRREVIAAHVQQARDLNIPLTDSN